MTPAADEMFSSGDELATKVRKPYTITKQRERWTEEEHQKFLEALKLYGRAWRRIEEHIGTKTAVQTRSHAQKFFSKLARESSGGGVCPADQAQGIEIPPPRPKRKPRHPYPRKAGTPLQSGSSTIEGGSVSPPPVASLPGLLPGVGLDKNAGFDRCNETENLCDGISRPETKMERARINTSPSSLKLFGQTMFVSNVQMTAGASVKPFVSNNSGGAFRKFASTKQATATQKTATYDEQRLDEGEDFEQAPGPMACMKLVAKSAKYSGSAFDATMVSELGTGLDCGLSDDNGKHEDKQDSGEHSSSKMDINSNYIPGKQEAPNIMTGHPRHVPVQCVIDGMVPESICRCAQSWPVLAPLMHQSSVVSTPNGNSSFLNSDMMNSWPSRFLPGFPWMQMQQGDTSAVGAVAAANVAAAASAWWSFYGAVPSPCIYPAIYTAANPTFSCNSEHVMGSRQQKKMKMTEREGELLLSAMPINLQMDTEGKSTSFHKQSDSKSLILEASDRADCMSQGSQTQNYTPSCMEESNDIGGHVEEQSCETEEQVLKMKNRWLPKEGSSSGSNTPSSNEAEIDPCLGGTSIDDSMGDYAQDFQFSGGRCVSEAQEDASNEKEEARDCNNPSTKQAEVMVKSGKHIYKDRCNSWSKGDGHFNDTWKEVSDKGRAAFQALFAGEVLPQSFSLPNNFGDAMDTKVDTPKQSLGKICGNKPELKVLCSVTAQNARYAGNGHTYGPRTSDTAQNARYTGNGHTYGPRTSDCTQKVLESSGATVSAQSEESGTENSLYPTTECVDANIQKAIKCMDTPSFGSCRSAGVGFVPYQRCLIQANKKHVIPGNL